MALATATITAADIADLIAVPFDPRRAKAHTTTNIPDDTIIDSTGSVIRLGSGRTVPLGVDGSLSITVPIPTAGSNPTTWQTTIHVSYPDQQAPNGRGIKSFGPFTITASGTLGSLVEQQSIPPEYLTTVTQQLDAKVAEATAAADFASAVAGADTADDLIVALDANPASDFRVQQDARLTATIAAQVPGHVAASTAPLAFAAQHKGLIEKLRTNQPVKFLIHSASILSGYAVTSTTEGTYQADAGGTGRKIIAALAAKYGNTNITVVNAGVAGASTRIAMDGGQANGHMGSVAAWLAQEAPDVVLMNYNSNDATVAQTPVAEYQSNWQRIIRDVRRYGADLLIVPPFEHYTPATQAALFESHKATARLALALEGIQPLAIERALEDPANPDNPLAGTTADGTHPNATGAQMIADAAADYFPEPSAVNSLASNSIGRQPLAGWTDPLQRAAHAEWVTVNGATRRSTRQPIAEGDGWDILSPPPVPANVRLRGSLACYDMVQGTSSTVIYDKSGSGNNAAITGTPTWDAGGGLTFSGDDIAVIPLDTLNRLKFTPGRGWFSVRVVLKYAATGATSTIIGRRGDATSAPFGFFASSGTYSIFERSNTISMGTAASATVYDDWLIVFSLWDDRVRYFKNGVLIGGNTMAGGVSLVSGDPAWPWTIGGRHTGTSLPGSLTPQFAGTIQWVDLAQSYVSPANTEAAALHANLKTYLSSRSLTWGT